MAGPKTPRELAHRMRDHRASTAPAMVSCEKPSPNPVTTPAKR